MGEWERQPQPGAIFAKLASNMAGCRKIGYGLLRMRFLGYDTTRGRTPVSPQERKLTELGVLSTRYKEGLTAPGPYKEH